MNNGFDDVQQVCKEYFLMFPEISKHKIESIVSTSRGDKDESMYRLVSLEEGGLDPMERLGLIDLLAQQPVSPPTPSGRSSSASLSPPSMGTSYRTEWAYLPSCEYCGKQLPAAELEIHIHDAHHLQLMERNKIQTLLNDHVQHHANRAAHIDKALMTRWGSVVITLVTPLIEDRQSYGMRRNALESLQLLVRERYPEAKVYLFGSGVTGLAVKESDTDTAVDAFNSNQLTNPDEAIILDTLFTRFASDRRHPWLLSPMGRDDFGLRKILRTRVPIIGNSFDNSVGARPKQGSRVVVYRPENVDNALEEVERAIADAQVTYKTRQVEGDKVLVTCSTEVDVVKFLTRCPRVELNNKKVPPLVYTNRWDMSCRLYGVKNSNLLRQYLKKPCLRMAGVAVKIWSKKVKINDPRVGLLSSYAVALMYVYYLIHTDEVQFIDPESVKLEDCPQIPDFIPPPSCDDAKQTLQEFKEDVGRAFLGFVNFYANVYDWEDDVITISTPQVVKKQSIGWTNENAIHVDRANSVHYHIRIQDPYELADPAPWGEDRPGNLNVTRKITKHRSLTIHSAFVKVWNTLLQHDTKAQIIF